MSAQQASPFDSDRLAAYLRREIGGFGAGLDVSQIKGGSSNPTFILTTDAGRYVLRKKPAGKLLPSAHQVDREFRVMRALGEHTDVPVPRMRHLCTDDSVIGTMFYVMDFVEGRIFRDAQLPGLSPAARTAVYDELNAVLARLHGVDYRAIGLGDYGKPGNYFERQIARWTTQYRGAETGPIPAMERLIEELPRRIPRDDTTSIAHGDYRPENIMFHPAEARIVAILDWELSTIGHPLADLAYNCVIYHSDSPIFGTLKGVDFKASGIPSEADYVAQYCRRTGRDGIDDFDFYLAFSIFRLASIGQGVLKRALDGISDANRAGTDNRGVALQAGQALEILHRSR